MKTVLFVQRLVQTWTKEYIKDPDYSAFVGGGLSSQKASNM